MRILISAGEASGEVYGAGLLESLRHLGGMLPEVGAIEAFGLGGERMRAAGCDIVVDAKNVAVVGIVEVLTHLPRIYGSFRRLVTEADKRKPDAAVLIDFPDFNFRLAKELHKRGIPVVYYVSPQLWAWRPKRLELVKKHVRKMLVIFPFEEGWYRERGVEAEFTGHPLAELERPKVSRAQFAARYKLDPKLAWVALLPGSRKKEVRMNLPGILQAAQMFKTRYEFLLPVASTLPRLWVEDQVAHCVQVHPGAIKLTYTDDARESLLHARAAAVASGTATVEAAILGTPFVMVYRVAPATYALGKRLVKVPFYAMPNLIAGRQVVTELVQENFTARNVATELQRILPEGPDRRKMMDGLVEVRSRLHGEAAMISTAYERAAQAVIRVLYPE
jgi:lipid-A-disaccharide synthase